jgi:glycolate oxidase FAD binding subunit
MCRLMAGSLGTLGVLTQVTLMIRPVAEASALLVSNVPDFGRAEKLLAALVRSAARPVAVDFVAGRWPVDGQAMGGMPEGSPPEGNAGRLYVGFEGAAAEVAWMVDQLRDLWSSVGAGAPMVVLAADAEPVWRWLVDFPANIQINVLPSDLVATVAKIVEMHPECAIQAHAGDGVIRISLPLPPGDGGAGEGGVAATTISSPVASISRLRALAAAAGGKLVVLRHADGFASTVADVWGPPGPEMRLMQSLKERFDPHSILNPGRFSYC